MNTRISPAPLAAAIVILLGGITPAFAGESLMAETTLTQSQSLTPRNETQVSASAVRVLRHIADARGDLHADQPDLTKAKTQLEEAQKDLAQIEEMLPTAVIKDRVWVAKKHLEYEDSKAVLPDLVPIYGSLDELVDLMPTQQAKNHLDKAKAALKTGDKSTANEQLEEVDAALLYVEADLPLHSTEQLIENAKAEIANKNPKAADKALAAAEDNVVFVSIGVQTPLAQAKTSLWHAWRERQLGHLDKAKADLNRAMTYLNQAKQGADKVTKEAVAGLVADAKGLQQNLQSDDETVVRELERAWQKTKALSERSAEYISTGWERLTAGKEAKKELIEAKLHLADARIDHLYSRDDTAAKADLATAKDYLDKVKPDAKTPENADLHTLISRVERLQQALANNDQKGTSEQAFQDTEALLSGLIQEI